MNADIAFISGRPGIPELLVVLVILLLLFGAKRLPELSRSLGRSINEFKRGKADEESDGERIEQKEESEPKKDKSP